VNDPETGVVLERALLHTIHRHPQNRHFHLSQSKQHMLLDKFVLSKLA
jgi:hypothetical protein